FVLQAEDGIRDRNVTGVQTCALPICSAGAVGDVCLQFFGADGELVPSDLHERVLGISAETLRAIPRKIGVAGGPRKFEAIRAAALGGWIDVLITDSYTARRLVDK